jgi:hypothetical protein
MPTQGYLCFCAGEVFVSFFWGENTRRGRVSRTQPHEVAAAAPEPLPATGKWVRGWGAEFKRATLSGGPVWFELLRAYA